MIFVASVQHLQNQGELLRIALAEPVPDGVEPEKGSAFGDRLVGFGLRVVVMSDRWPMTR